MKKIIASLVAAVMAFGASAAALTDIVWKGEAGADLGTKTNWDPQPSKNLSDSSGNAYRLVFNGNATPVIKEADKVYCGEIKVTAGDVKITRKSDASFNGRFIINNTTHDADYAATKMVIEVAEGATLQIGESGTTVHVNNSGVNRVYVKAGKGKLTLYGNSSNMNVGWEVEGEMEASSQFGGGDGGLIEIKPGATLKLLSNDTIYSTAMSVDLGEGAVLDMNGGKETIRTVTGVGTVRNGDLQMTLAGGPYAFAGKFESMTRVALVRYASTDGNKGTTQAQFGYILERADALANVGCHVTLSVDSGVTDPVVTDLRNSALRFAPGIGEFYCATNDLKFILHDGKDRNPVYLADTNGNPIVLHTNIKQNSYVSYVAFAGPGSLVCDITSDSTSKTLVVTNTMMDVTGALDFGPANSDYKVKLGDGTEACAFDFSKPKSIGTRGAKVVFNNPTAVTYAGTLLGTGTFDFQKDVTIGSLCASGSGLILRGDATINGGSAELSYSSPISVSFEKENATLTVNGGNFYGARTVSEPEPNVAPLPRGLLMRGDHQGTSTLTVNGGDVAIRDNQSYGPRVKNLNGGRLHLTHGQAFLPNPSSSFTPENPDTYNFNGGELVVSSRDYRYSGYPTLDIFPETNCLVVTIGPKGGSIDDERIYENTTTFADCCLLEKPFSVADGTAGGWTQRGYLEYRYKHALPIAGTFAGIGGSSSVFKDTPNWTPSFFGSGDMVLKNHYIDLHLLLSTGEHTFRPHGENRKLTVEGAGALYLRTASSHKKATVEINDLDVAEGSAFFIYNYDSLGGDDSRVTIANEGDRALTASGRTKLPVFYIDRAYNVAQPLTYGGNGLAPCTPYSAEFGEGNILQSAVARTIPANTAEKIDMYLMRGESATLEIRSGASLTVGGAEGCRAISMCHASIYGEGHLSFGGAPAYFLCGCGTTARDEAHASVQVPIRNVTDLNVLGLPDIESYGWRGVRLGKANEMTGVTRINAAIVQAEHPGCFSTGDIYLGEGRRHGGGVRFCCEGAVWHNNVHADGIGIRVNKYNSPDRREGSFSIGFSRNGELAGNVIIGRAARLTTSTNDVTGVISGVVSGGRLEVFQSAGAIRLTGHNTYAGGTEVWDATLELAEADSAGADEIWLSPAKLLDGTVTTAKLRLVNAEPIVFSNEVHGIGEIVLAGAPVTFAGRSFGGLPVKTLAKGSVVKIVAAAAGASPVDVAASTLKSVIVADGDTVLSGDVTVNAVWGHGTIRGGAVTVTGAIDPDGTLTFAETPVLAGATLTVRTSGGAVDKVVVPDDFDLTGLKLVVEQVGLPVVFPAKAFLETSGALSGSFATVTLPAKRTKNYSVDVGAKTATLSYQKPGALLIVR